MNDHAGTSRWPALLAVPGILIVALISTRPTRADDVDRSGPRQASGFARALVVDLNDPEAAGRIQIKFPRPHGEITAWAAVSLPLGGNRTGLWALPEVGDEVLVGFEHGDVSNPVVIGSLWNGQRPPTSSQ